jgi:adenylate cyclase
MLQPKSADRVEIERKFLVDKAKWRPAAPGVEFRQGYLSSVKERVVRVRIASNQAWLTIKGLSAGNARDEFEYEFPIADASYLLDHLCERPILTKTRYREQFGGKIWEIDVFHGDNEGLIIAEIELGFVSEPFEKPEWATREVSDDSKYFNNNLAANPYKNWGL